jgi:hypothetical protein
MDSYETSYQNNYNEQPAEYPSYKEDYKQEYPQYGKDNNSYKSKDKERGSVSINKVNCINNNVNINGNNTGDINVGNSGRTTSNSGTDGEGYLGGGSSDGYGEGYNKQKGESFNCIINNNNTNNNFGAAGNATDGNGDIVSECEECFRLILTPEQLTALELLLDTVGIDIIDFEDPVPPITTVFSFAELCEVLGGLTGEDILVNVENIFEQGDIMVNEETEEFLAECLAVSFGFDLPDPELSGFSTTSGAAAGGLSNLPTIAQGIGDSTGLTATEKITKLKQQWLDLLP